MKDIGIYILDNKYYTDISSKIPSLYYYKLNETITIKPNVTSNENIIKKYPSFKPHLSLIEPKGEVNLYYMFLDIKKKKQSDRIKIFDSLMDLYYIPEIIYYLFLENVKYYLMDDIKYVLNYISRLSNKGFKPYYSDFLSYITDYHTVDYIRQYNTELSRCIFNTYPKVRPLLTCKNIYPIYSSTNIVEDTRTDNYIIYKTNIITNIINYLKSEYQPIPYGYILLEFQNLLLWFGHIPLDQMQLLVSILMPYNQIVNTVESDNNDINLFNVLPNNKTNDSNLIIKQKMKIQMINMYFKYNDKITIECPCSQELLHPILCNKKFNCLYVENNPIDIPYTPVVEEIEEEPIPLVSSTHYYDYETYR